MREFWFDEATDHAMDDEHRFVWRAMLDKVGADPGVALAGARVLDVGCNMGGFLRLLVDEAGIGEGRGFDPAPRPIALATERRGDRPLAYAVADRVPEGDGWRGFDVAFSHEVLFVLHDLKAHARDVAAALRPGGIYYAVMGTHDRNATMADWHAEVKDHLGLPPIYSLEEVVDSFTSEGFEAHIGRLHIPFIPTAFAEAPLIPTLDYYDHQKVILRFVNG